MTKTRVYKYIGIAAVYAAVFGVLLPFLISAESTLAVIGGTILGAAMIIVPIINFSFNLIKNESN